MLRAAALVKHSFTETTLWEVEPGAAIQRTREARRCCLSRYGVGTPHATQSSLCTCLNLVVALYSLIVRRRCFSGTSAGKSILILPLCIRHSRAFVCRELLSRSRADSTITPLFLATPTCRLVLLDVIVRHTTRLGILLLQLIVCGIGG